MNRKQILIAALLCAIAGFYTSLCPAAVGEAGAVAVALEETGSLKAPKHWLKGPTPDWYTHLDDAKAAAKRTGRMIYTLHTGSDWCPPCKRLEKNILSTDEFKNFARKNLILLFVDAPRYKPIPRDQKNYNRQLAAKLKFGGGVPSILLLNSEGTPVARIEGRRDAATHINAIKSALQNHK